MQYTLLQLLTNRSENPNLFVIGDPNQSIYGFRGSSARFISRFISDYKKTRIYKLSTSYRCSDNILKASGEVIQQDSLQGLSEGVKIKIAPLSTDKSEAEYIARTIEQLSGGLRFFSMDSNITEGQGTEEIESLSDFAILCRTKAQMKTIEKALLDHTIPYQMVAEDEFFSHPAVKAVKNILELSENPQNQYLRERLEKQKVLINAQQQVLEEIKNKTGPEEKIRYILSLIGEDNRKEEISEKLISISSGFNGNTTDFMKYLSLGSGMDMYEAQTEKVTVMTLHASKGLEFKCVFIAGCENGLIPYSLFKNQETDKEEEQRLLYVGMTRAQSLLYITHARKRFLMGKEREMQKSPFLNRIEKELTEIEKNTYRKKQKDDGQLKLF
jgi:superfamily I DNA/RNA helicase